MIIQNKSINAVLPAEHWAKSGGNLQANWDAGKEFARLLQDNSTMDFLGGMLQGFDEMPFDMALNLTEPDQRTASGAEEMGKAFQRSIPVVD